MKTSPGASSAVLRALTNEQSGALWGDIGLHSSIVHHLHIGIAIRRLKNFKDPKTLNLVFANPAAEKDLSGPGETVYEKTPALIFPELPDTQLPKILQEVAVSRKAKDFGEIPYSDEKCAIAFSLCGFTLYPILVFASHLMTSLNRKRPHGISNQAQLLDLATDSMGGRNRKCSDSTRLKS